MSPEKPAPKHAPKAVERFVFFSDAVFAFSLTLLAAGLKLPAHQGRLHHAELVEALGEMIPAITCYLITFGVVARLWVRHHRGFEKLQDYDGRLILLNFALLLCVSLEPFSIDLFMESIPDPLPIALYTGMLALTGAASFAVFFHSRTTPGLLSETLSGDAFLRECLGEIGLPLMTGLLFLCACFFPPRDFGACTVIAAVVTFGGKRIASRVLDRRAAASAT
jgi:uncharacterized membrane protein